MIKCYIKILNAVCCDLCLLGGLQHVRGVTLPKALPELGSVSSVMHTSKLMLSESPAECVRGAVPRCGSVPGELSSSSGVPLLLFLSQ